MVVKKTFDVPICTTKLSLCTAYNHFSVLFYSMSGINNLRLFVIKYLSQRCHQLSKARFNNFVPAFQKLSKGGTEIVQARDSCRMPGFCASIVFAFSLGVELRGRLGGSLRELGWRGKGGGGSQNQTLRMP